MVSDAVYIASPHSEHHDHALLAIGAGKPVLVEKAFTRNATEARAVIRAVPRGACSWPRRCGPATCRTTTSSARSSRRGCSATWCSSGRTTPSGSTARPRATAAPELAGGALLDLGVYPVSFADHLLGPPISVAARGSSATGASTPRGHRPRLRNRRGRRIDELDADPDALHRRDRRDGGPARRGRPLLLTDLGATAHPGRDGPRRRPRVAEPIRGSLPGRGVRPLSWVRQRESAYMAHAATMRVKVHDGRGPRPGRVVPERGPHARERSRGRDQRCIPGDLLMVR